MRKIFVTLTALTISSSPVQSGSFADRLKGFVGMEVQGATISASSYRAAESDLLDGYHVIRDLDKQVTVTASYTPPPYDAMYLGLRKFIMPQNPTRLQSGHEYRMKYMGGSAVYQVFLNETYKPKREQAATNPPQKRQLISLRIKPGSLRGELSPLGLRAIMCGYDITADGNDLTITYRPLETRGGLIVETLTR